MTRIYYAHPMSWYGTGNEKLDLDAIHEAYRNTKDGVVINPANLELEMRAWRTDNPDASDMDFFTAMVRHSHIVVFRSFYDGTVGAGVAKEVIEALLAGIEVRPLRSAGDGVPYLDAAITGKDFPLTKVRTVEQTKSKIRNHVL